MLLNGADITPALRIRGLNAQFGRVQAIKDVNFDLAPGARHALIGPNGAGKTTLINLLTGALMPSGGSIFLSGQNVTQRSIDFRARAGLVRSFQISSLFPNLTPLNSIVMVICERRGLGRKWWKSLLRQRDVFQEAHSLLEQFRLICDANTPVSELAYGKQRLLEVALALAVNPRVLLLDEPTAGISVSEGAKLFQVIAELFPELSILFVEHNIDLVFGFAHRISVLSAGEILAEGTPDSIEKNQRVRDAYLGSIKPFSCAVVQCPS